MSPLLIAIIVVFVGLVLLVWSADRLIFGASTVARYTGISPMLIGLTIVALGTSMPEILVSSIAAYKGHLSTAVGNALGSNIINILLIIGLAALLKPIRVTSLTIKREYPLLVAATLLAYFFLSDHFLSRIEGLILIAAFFSFIIFMVYCARTIAVDDPLMQDINNEESPPISLGQAIFWFVLGMLLLLAASQLLVHGSVYIARYIGVSDLVIGLSIVALGTSLPELATSIVGIIKGEVDLALGNIIGSNIINILAVLGISAIIAPGVIDPQASNQDSYIMIAATIILLLMSLRHSRQPRLSKFEGLFLLTAFIAYQYFLFSSFA
ncbi:calcium/sodium antiporter [Rheinheimera sp. MMS21-TC3]|uniref:calcium/sodium antiporter n=1 Tax=Rheinheimera sp. MMS21-TC3 TaxID=3072790 RepID=UPI0028C386DA|nr:calcium/sodium antiporter [Rheinheimera sp. MMS21-TC3]WNO62174.1 calcium/sodium antiporter [Rheinheimera sp. MMS21-TC3]